MKFIKSISKICMGLFSLPIITMMAASAIGPKETGGLGMNGFLVLVAWLFLAFLIKKGHPLIPAVASLAIVTGMKLSTNGYDRNKAEALIVPFVFLLLLLALFKWFESMEKEDEIRNERIRNNRKSGIACCPRCGSSSIQYYATGIPYMSGGKILYFTRNNYHCNNCEHEW